MATAPAASIPMGANLGGYGGTTGAALQQYYAATDPTGQTTTAAPMPDIASGVANANAQMSTGTPPPPTPAAPAPTVQTGAASATPPDPNNNLRLPSQSENFYDQTQGLYTMPGAAESFYGQHGNDLAGPSNSQRLFDQGMAGTDPFYDYAQTKSNRALNDQFASMGGGNSGALMRAVSDNTANLRGQQAQGMHALAGQADSADVARFGATEGAAQASDAGMLGRLSTGQSAASNASSAKIARFNALMNGSLGLANGESNGIDSYYGTASNTSTPLDLEAIQAEINKGGVDANALQQFYNNVLAGAKVATSASKPGG